MTSSVTATGVYVFPGFFLPANLADFRAVQFDRFLTLQLAHSKRIKEIFYYVSYNNKLAYYLPRVSTTLAKLVAKLAAGVVDTGGKFVAGVVDTSGKFATGVVDTDGSP